MKVFGAKYVKCSFAPTASLKYSAVAIVEMRLDPRSHGQVAPDVFVFSLAVLPSRTTVDHLCGSCTAVNVRSEALWTPPPLRHRVITTVSPIFLYTKLIKDEDTRTGG